MKLLNRHSISFGITLTFILSLLLIIISFALLDRSIAAQNDHFIKKRMHDTVRMLLREHRAHRGRLTDEFKEHLSALNFTLISNPTQQRSILTDRDTRLLFKRKTRLGALEYLDRDGQKIIHVVYPMFRYILIDDLEIRRHQPVLLVALVIILLLFIALYYITIKKLKPLSALHKKVQRLANEQFDLGNRTDKQDEISLLSNEFHHTAQKLKSIKESRNIFIRNIMHELKTPITKGKLLIELPQTDENTQKMQTVFHRLESLINEFASIEELIATQKNLDIKPYLIDDLIDNAADILMCDEEQIIKAYGDLKVNVDFNLFSIAIKNLIDNAIKYSAKQKVTIEADESHLIFINDGKELAHPLEKYTEPFFKGEDNRSNQSFGLGLYIVQSIVNAHGGKLHYDYIEGKNRFIVDL